MWITLQIVGPGAGRLVLGVERGLQSVGLTRVPLVPSWRCDGLGKPCVQVHHRRITPARTPEVNIGHAFGGADLAVVKYVAALLLRITLALRRQVDGLMKNGVDLAV